MKTFQKFLVGDLVVTDEGKYYIITSIKKHLKNVVVNGFIDLFPKNNVYTDNIIIPFGKIKLIRRYFSNTSDYFCKEICNIKTDCSNCPLNIPINNLRNYYFIGDLVTIKGYRCTIEKSRLGYNYYNREYSDSIRDIIFERAIDPVEKWKSIFHKIGASCNIYYGLSYCDGSLTSISSDKKPEDFRLYLRGGFTIDPTSTNNYCIMCSGSNNCGDCIINKIKNEYEKG